MLQFKHASVFPAPEEQRLVDQKQAKLRAVVTHLLIRICQSFSETRWERACRPCCRWTHAHKRTHTHLLQVLHQAQLQLVLRKETVCEQHVLHANTAEEREKHEDVCVVLWGVGHFSVCTCKHVKSLNTDSSQHTREVFLLHYIIKHMLYSLLQTFSFMFLPL